jgi:PIN domain nuclease of toxin-antitoxin system
LRVLLDTHLVYWWFYETARLPAAALATIKDADEIFVSSVTVWEMAIKVRLGKLSADPQKLVDQMTANDFQELPVFSRHALLVATLPMHHSDPFDRLLVAQALSEPLHLLTADTQLKPYSDLVICV